MNVRSGGLRLPGTLLVLALMLDAALRFIFPPRCVACDRLVSGERRMCVGDEYCGGGYCVDSRCYAELGNCILPPP